VLEDLEHRLASMFSATAFRRYEEGMKRWITYRDACKFWGLPETVTGVGVDEHVERVPAILERVEQLLICGNLELLNGQRVSEDDLRALRTVHQFLVETFTPQLSRQRSRLGKWLS
jgi:hypothetical protein